MVFDIALVIILSFVPMLLYIAVLWWFDRYEKEPLALLLFAFIWGAIPSIILSIILELLFDVPVLALSNSSPLMYELIGSSLVAPVVEEGVKAFVLLILLFFLRYQIDGPMDGLIYGGIAGFGFAAVENFFYLLGAYSEGGLMGAIGLSVFRAGLFGLNHAMYTGFTGLGIALALEVARRKWLRPVLVFLGFLLAVSAHAFHNATTTFWGYSEGVGTLFLTILGDWFGIIFLVGVAIWAYFLERRRINRYAEALVRANVIPPGEVAILKSVFLRNVARAKALLTLNFDRWLQLTRYYHRVTKAAFVWHRVQNGDTKAKESLSRLQKEFLKMRPPLAATNKIAVQ